MKYRRRKIQGPILENLESPEILAILGSRLVGKTTLLKMLQQDILEYQEKIADAREKRDLLDPRRTDGMPPEKQKEQAERENSGS